MNNVFKSEWLKQKSSSDKKLLIFIPFLAIFIAFILAGPINLESFSIYWWEGGFLFILLGLLFLADYSVEKNAGAFQNIQLGRYTFTIYLVKIILKLKDVLISTIIFTIIFYGISFLFSGVMSVNIGKDFICLLLIGISSAWVLPLLYFLSKWVNSYLLLAANSLICLLVAPLIAQTSIWFIFPYTYHYKIAYAFLHLKPSGDLDVATSGVEMTTILISMVLSILFFVSFLSLLKWRITNEQNSKK
ncbi:TPA: lantibiotic ABC transporter permease [Streptococcus equi subsp. zooepidemicus]|nr:lantibiotic ABC transporter permease [Streptococcus equi subsp. zooepidemicus]HEL1179432.1 lantibiotic ABC transporter permease [Streptococcus equi subsp. zooepidemicus]HEL1236199.1 lantibiotic ABC transporter permease [Streptococcus equi subsp. zooepidemicus]